MTWHKYITLIFVAVLLFAICGEVTAKEEYDPQDCKKYEKVANKEGWCIPVIKLAGDLNKIFKIPEYDCKFISGMTCRITYNGKLPLPSKVHFIGLDKNGKELGDKTRLIYPKLEANESGYATFRIKGNPTTIVITGEWDGPYRNPY